MTCHNDRRLRSVTRNFAFRAATLILLATQATSCVPLLVGGVVGYVAREEGVGTVRSLNGDTGTTYDPAPAYGDGAAYDYSGPEYTDEPVY